MKITEQQKKSFEDNGYLVIPDIINSEQLEELRYMTDQVLNGTITPESGGVDGDFQLQMEPAMKDNPDIPRREKIRVVFHLCHTHSFFWNHVTRPEILDIVKGLLGPSIKLYTDQMFVKPPHHGSEVPFHQDHAYWLNVEPYNLITCWLALDDATVENGCVRMIPGSHKQLIPHHKFEGAQSAGLMEEELDLNREVPVELKAGSAMFHHSLTVHRSFPNRSDKGRRGLASIYMPADITFVDPQVRSLSKGWDFQYGFKDI